MISIIFYVLILIKWFGGAQLLAPNVDIAFRWTHYLEYHKGYADELGHTPMLFNDSLYSLEMPENTSTEQ